jgi:hypothetical protein
MDVAKRYNTGRKVYRNEIDRLVIESGLTNREVADKCGVTMNRVVALRRSNTFDPALIESIRQKILPYSTPSQDCSMLSKSSISELADKLIEEIISRFLPHYKREQDDTPRDSSKI